MYVDCVLCAGDSSDRIEYRKLPGIHGIASSDVERSCLRT